MIIISGTVPILPNVREEAMRLMRQVMFATRQEPGCLTYNFYSEVEDPNWFRVYEEWESEETLAAHLKADHTREFLKAVVATLATPPDLKKYVVKSVQPLAL